MGTFGSVLVLCKTSSRPSGSVPSAPSTSPFAETSWDFFFFFFPPFRWAGEEGGGLGVRLVFF